jgi:hypothetical protein
MTTAIKIINQALGLLGIRSGADPVSGEDAAIARERLNTLLDAWRLESLYTYATQTVTATLPANTATLDIGPTGDYEINPRPVRIESGRYSSDGIDYPIESITQAEYERIEVKATAANPCKLFYNPTLPDGIVYFYPVAVADVEVSLVLQIPLESFADLTTDYELAPGYEKALVYTLAEECGPDFERDVPPTVTRNAKNARRMVKRTNHVVPQLRFERPQHYSILEG